MSLREEQCKKVCRILDDDLANRPTERDSLVVAVQLAFESLLEPHWIPVTERLPENNDPVNVTWVNHNPEVYYSDIKDKPFTATAHYHRGHWYWYSSVTQDNLNEYGTWIPDLVDKDVEITAWCELPKPFKGGDGMTIDILFGAFIGFIIGTWCGLLIAALMEAGR